MESKITAEYDKTIAIFDPVTENVKITDKLGRGGVRYGIELDTLSYIYWLWFWPFRASRVESCLVPVFPPIFLLFVYFFGVLLRINSISVI